MIHVIVDLETRSLSVDAVIASIGATAGKFEGSRFIEHAHFYAVLPYADQMLAGRTISRQTETWWADQSASARRVLSDTPTYPSTGMALAGFNDFLNGFGEDVLLWGNGAASDNAWLRSLYPSMSMELAVPFFNDMCFRTIRNLYNLHTEAYDNTWFEGVMHNALDDARHEAKTLAIMAQALGLRL